MTKIKKFYICHGCSKMHYDSDYDETDIIIEKPLDFLSQINEFLSKIDWDEYHRENDK